MLKGLTVWYILKICLSLLKQLGQNKTRETLTTHLAIIFKKSKKFQHLAALYLYETNNIIVYYRDRKCRRLKPYFTQLKNKELLTENTQRMVNIKPFISSSALKMINLVKKTNHLCFTFSKEKY